MKQDIKAKWVAALRSGNYQQGHQKLNDVNENRFCCLGVLCDIHAKETGGKWDVYAMGHGFYHGFSGYPPSAVIEWAALSEMGERVYHQGHYRTLPILNDYYKLSFSEIANLIEAEL